jgi:hypothetical protein
MSRQIKPNTRFVSTQTQMAPKARGQRKTSNAAQVDDVKKVEKERLAMPPPADPSPEPLILEPEVNSLSSCFRV